ncbi:methyltransferase domain-containing protein [Amycolatopsis cihanbeyliensis]|uniref:Protein-L-isoaspartate O-methyltransferase n=1 Tax=Amycolatopsis cihanbeyliensis TaxID=1128664 RepID=A0A542CV24_AMYCI|nr:methyltransferase domain-containing protein [Amycolatopsis cihanbeyliensis]TQI94664.1 protein-L-isoaspartate(D-aspartate) O-methyltransferase [Amycolatopsis cihanbeyliensis]
MTAGVTEPTWRPLARRLADRLTADGDLRTPQWRAALLAVPRHEFVPRYYLQDTSTRPARWIAHEPHDPADVARWLELVYSPTTLITEIVDDSERGVQVPVCSSTKPDLMIRMLEALQLSTGMRALEIGTGTGYNAGLMAHRLGDRNVYSVDIDPALVTAARHRLSGLGYRPTLAAGDGADGLADHAPFDRIIATCALRAIPPAWIDQLRPGGLVLAHLEGPLGAGNLVALRRGEQPVVQGKFLPWWGCFMRRRTTTGPTSGSHRPTPTTQQATTRPSTLDPAELDGGFRFLAQLHLPAETFRSIRLADDHTPVTYLLAPDGSWAEVTRHADACGHYTAREAGPTPLWTAVESAWTEWNHLGTPPWHDFGITATPNEHRIWHSDPAGPSWRLPIPTRRPAW